MVKQRVEEEIGNLIEVIKNNMIVYKFLIVRR